MNVAQAVAMVNIYFDLYVLETYTLLDMNLNLGHT
jgi:hypothetical protein